MLMALACKCQAHSWLAADFGVEEAVTVDGLDKAAITQKLEQLVKKGESMPR